MAKPYAATTYVAATPQVFIFVAFILAGGDASRNGSNNTGWGLGNWSRGYGGGKKNTGEEEDRYSSLAPALYIFGDSLVDNGNNNLLPTAARANYLPYGINFDGGPTGRFTNGKSVGDFTAEFLGLPYPPPYVSLFSLGKLQLTGINFASGSCGILFETGKILGDCLSIVEQINSFEKVKWELAVHYSNPDELSNYLSESVFVLAIGSNDYLVNYLNPAYPVNRLRYTPQSYAQYLIDNLSQQLQRLYNLGARKFVMFELGPIGCIPYVKRLFGHQGLCNEDINQHPKLFNDRLESMLQNLKSKLEGSAFILGHVYSPAYDAMFNPSKYGLADSTNPCCATLLNSDIGCIPNGAACQNPNGNYYFDGFHLTQTLYETVAVGCFNGSSICKPNIQELVKATI